VILADLGVDLGPRTVGPKTVAAARAWYARHRWCSWCSCGRPCLTFESGRLSSAGSLAHRARTGTRTDVGWTWFISAARHLASR